MKLNELQAFIQKIRHNAGLQEALSFAQDVDAVAAIGRQGGLQLAAADMTYSPQHFDSLGAEELELVAGGKPVVMSSSTHISNWSTWICGCKPKSQN
jgi:predicted ribosomally synthesized peptide with nif11-like leader